MCILVCLITTTVAFLTIGLTTYLLGCNNVVYPAGCVGYYADVGIVQNSGVSKITCQSCTTINKVNVCHPYTCYNSVVNFNICTADLGSPRSIQDAENLLNSYKPGTQHNVYRLKTQPNQCTANTKMVTNDLPIVGIFFLTLTAIPVIILCIIYLMCKERLFYDSF
jgi:hypothetical protein